MNHSGQFFRFQVQCPRQSLRVREFSAAVLVDENVSEPCLIRDISPDGAQIRIGAATRATQPNSYLINLKSASAYQAYCVWRQGSLAGLRFKSEYRINDPLPPHLAFLGARFHQAKRDQAETLKSRGMVLRAGP